MTSYQHRSTRLSFLLASLNTLYTISSLFLSSLSLSLISVLLATRSAVFLLLCSLWTEMLRLISCMKTFIIDIKSLTWLKTTKARGSPDSSSLRSELSDRFWFFYDVPSRTISLTSESYSRLISLSAQSSLFRVSEIKSNKAALASIMLDSCSLMSCYSLRF